MFYNDGKYRFVVTLFGANDFFLNSLKSLAGWRILVHIFTQAKLAELRHKIKSMNEIPNFLINEPFQPNYCYTCPYSQFKNSIQLPIRSAKIAVTRPVFDVMRNFPANFQILQSQLLTLILICSQVGWANLCVDPLLRLSRHEPLKTCFDQMSLCHSFGKHRRTKGILIERRLQILMSGGRPKNEWHYITWRIVQSRLDIPIWTYFVIHTLFNGNMIILKQIEKTCRLLPAHFLNECL